MSAAVDEAALREGVVRTARAMNALGINQGKAGNVSVRFRDPVLGDGFLITPSGAAYDAMSPDMVVPVHLDGTYTGPHAPSTEWRMHRDIYAGRPRAMAVVHTHSTFATALACLRRRIPAFHYMVAVAGGTSIEVADYATFGTQALSDAMLRALGDRKACLLANHGMICWGAGLEAALDLAVEVEALARQYWHAAALGEPALLSDAEMAPVLRKFVAYAKPGTERTAEDAAVLDLPRHEER